MQFTAIVCDNKVKHLRNTPKIYDYLLQHGVHVDAAIGPTMGKHNVINISWFEVTISL